MAETSSLLNCRTGNRTGGSNPPLTAALRKPQRKLCGFFMSIRTEFIRVRIDIKRPRSPRATGGFKVWRLKWIQRASNRSSIFWVVFQFLEVVGQPIFFSIKAFESFALPMP